MEKLSLNNSIAGFLLVATPQIDTRSSIFSRSVIYLLSHSETGAIGVVVNNVLKDVNPSFVFKSFNIDFKSDDLSKMPLLVGGPVQPEMGFVLHTSDYKKDILLGLNGGLSLSSNINILNEIAQNKGPRKKLFCLGYSVWDKYQLDAEIKDSKWFLVPYSDELVFDIDPIVKWRKCLEYVGINEAGFSPDAGHC